MIEAHFELKIEVRYHKSLAEVMNDWKKKTYNNIIFCEIMTH